MPEVPENDPGTRGADPPTPDSDGVSPMSDGATPMNEGAGPTSKRPSPMSGRAASERSEATPGTDPASPAGTGRWLAVDGTVVAPLDVADTVFRRTRGLLGRSTYDRAMWFPRTSSVHTFGMHFAIDVAFCDRDLRVVGSCRMVPWRVGRPRRCRSIIEAAAGSFERWGLHHGSQLEVRSEP